MVVKRPCLARIRRTLSVGLFLGGWALLVRAAEPARINFELPPGEAAVTLKIFSRQSGDEIIYLADQVRALRTKGVAGKLTPREALDRLLEGSGLSAVQDEKTGAFAIRPGVVPVKTAGPAPGDPSLIEARTILLPPIFVEGTPLSAPRWRYTKLPGMEFLSCCDDDTTEQLIERIYHLNQRLEAFLPAQFRLRLAVPTAFVLYGDNQQPFDFTEIIDRLQPPGGAAGTREAMTIRYLPNFRLADRDELAIFYIPKDNASGAGDIHLNNGFVRYLLDHRTPPLPGWFVEGMMALYQSSPLEVEPLYLEKDFSSDSGELTAAKFPFGSALIRLPNSLFGSETKKLSASDPDWKSQLLPMAEVFSPPPPAGRNSPAGAGEDRFPEIRKTNVRFVRWWSQSALFIHWALANDDGKSRAAFWKFVDLSSHAPATEAMFRKCFGRGYDEMNRLLADYLPGAVRTEIRLYSSTLPELEPVTLRAASVAEVSRIKGNLERLEAAYVRQKYPNLAVNYLERARRTFRYAYDQGARDPGLLEVMGLGECDAGNDEAARPFLEAAAHAGAARPRVYYELARLRYQELEGTPTGGLSPKQTNDLLHLLRQAQTHPPPLPEVYELIAAVWQQSTLPPRRENRAVLDEGLAYFPANLRLLYAVAAMNATHGFASEAGILIQRGLQLAPAGADHDRFLKLQSASLAK
jgi:hypothetical protein